MSTSRKSHPALAFSRAQLRPVQVGNETRDVWMAPDMDSLLNDFIEAGQANSEWNQNRCPFGAVLWPSARALWEWLTAQPERFSEVAGPISNSELRVIELGAGVGFLSALLASRTQWSLVSTDYEPAYADYLEANCKLFGAKPPRFETLDWCEPIPDHLRGKFDLAIACDVLYDDSHLESLPRISAELLTPDGALLLADPERFRFQTALSKIKEHFNHVKINQTTIENTQDDAIRSGVVNPETIQTRIQIVHCQKPFTSRS